MVEWLNECHFYPFLKKNMTRGIVSSGIQSMVNDAFLFKFNDAFSFCVFVFNDDAFLFKFNDAFYLNLFKALFIFIQSFIPPPIPIISNHFYPFLSNSKISFTFQKL